MNKKEIKRREEKEENNKKKRSKELYKKKGELIFHSLFSLHVVQWKEKSL